MKGHRLNFGERRRRMLAKKVDRLDRLETRNTITEPISVLGLSLTSLRGLVQLGIMDADGAKQFPRRIGPTGQSAGPASTTTEPSTGGPRQFHPKRSRLPAETGRQRGRWRGLGAGRGGPIHDRDAKSG